MCEVCVRELLEKRLIVRNAVSMLLDPPKPEPLFPRAPIGRPAMTREVIDGR